MSQLIPFENSQLPAYLKSQPLGNSLSTASGLGFPTVSIKGKVFHIKRSDSLTIVSTIDENGEQAPARYIDVVILNGNPGTAKVYYAGGYTEGSDSAPQCFSNDGKVPSPEVAEPESSNCATCAHNIWGSRISEDGKKGRECSDSKRLAIATSDAPQDAMLIRVPAASLKAWNEYLKMLSTRGVSNYQAVVTRIGFDYSVAHPALTFKPVGFLDEGTYASVVEMVESDLVGQIIGTKTTPDEQFEDNGTEVAVVKQVTKAAAKPVAKAIAKPVEKVVEAEPVEAKVEPKVEAKVVAKSAPVVVDDIESGLDAALDSVDWDD